MDSLFKPFLKPFLPALFNSNLKNIHLAPLCLPWQAFNSGRLKVFFFQPLQPPILPIASTSFTISSNVTIRLSFTIISGLSIVVFFHILQQAYQFRTAIPAGHIQEYFLRAVIQRQTENLFALFRKCVFSQIPSKISSCVMKMIIVDGKCLYFVIFPDFKTGVSSKP